MQNEMRDRLVELFYENNVRCDQTIEHLVDDVVSIFEDLINRQQSAIDVYMQENDRLKTAYIQVSMDRDEAKAEIEKLNVESVGMRGACNSYKMHYDNAQAEIERLQVRLRKERHQFDDLGKMYSEIRAEAIKELKAKIHEKLHEAEMHGNFEPVVTREMFDSVVKEVVGEQE